MEITAYILNLVFSKSVLKTPLKLLYGFKSFLHHREEENTQVDQNIGDRKRDVIRFPRHLKRAFSFVRLGTASSNFVGGSISCVEWKGKKVGV